MATAAPLPTQADKIDALIRALQIAKRDAERGDFFWSHTGAAAVNAMHDLTGCDALYDLAQDIEFEIPERPSTVFMGAWGSQPVRGDDEDGDYRRAVGL